MTDLKNIKTIGERLRAARELQGRSIEDIALATRIDRKYLCEIEQGVIPAMPLTYIRAFIRDYAQTVGLDMAEVLSDTGAEGTVPDDEQQQPDIVTPPSFNISTVRKSPVNQYKILFLLAMLVILGLVGTIVWLRQDNTVTPTKEIPFSEAIKDREQKLTVSTPTDSSPSPKLSPAAIAQIDTLLLEAVASESVWVRIAVDGVTAPEKMIPRFSRMSWKAKQSFVLSIGNAAAASFTLNGRKLGTLSPIKRQMNNIKFDRETLRKLQAP
jgi:cytoskeleton protein RodZ